MLVQTGYKRGNASTVTGVPAVVAAPVSVYVEIEELKVVNRATLPVPRATYMDQEVIAEELSIGVQEIVTELVAVVVVMVN